MSLFIGLGVLVSAQAQPLINVDFGAGQTASDEVGFAAIGETPNDFWNWYTRDDGNGGWLTFGSVQNLKTAAGTVTGAGLTIANAPGSWGNGSSDFMYDGYDYPFDGGNITIVITNLQPGTYDFYIYGHGSTQNNTHTNMNGVYQLSSAGVDYGTLSTATNGTGWDSTNWQAGQQYVLFSSVKVVSGQPVVVTCLPGMSGEALIAGMQMNFTGSAAPPHAPVITSQPSVSQFANVGDSASISVSATGSQPLAYQWYHGGMNIAASNSMMTLSHVALSDEGTYWVKVSNAGGATNSLISELRISPDRRPPVGYPVPPTNPPVWPPPPPPPQSNQILSLIDVDFGAGTTTSEKGFAAVGQTSNDFWNFYTRDDSQGGWLSFGSLGNLKTANSTPTSAGFTIANAPGAWGNASSDYMYNGYLYPFDGGNITIVITNLPSGTYDVYVYGHGDAEDQSTVCQLSSGTEIFATQSTTTSGSAWQTTNWQNGQQYVLFQDFKVLSNQPVTLTVLPDPAGYAIIAGMQLAQVVPPIGPGPVAPLPQPPHLPVPPIAIFPTNRPAPILPTNPPPPILPITTPSVVRPALALTKNSSGETVITVNGTAGDTYEIDVADTPTSTIWTPLATVKLQVPSFKFVDPEITPTGRFYRLKVISP